MGGILGAGIFKSVTFWGEKKITEKKSCTDDSEIKYSKQCIV